MSTQGILFVNPLDPDSDSAWRPWQEALLLPVASEPALTQYCRLLARQFEVTRVVIPAQLARRLPEEFINDRNVYTYDRTFGDGRFSRAESFALTTETVLIDVGRLASIDVEALLAAHRDSGAGLTIFCGPGQREYCSEQIALDPGGLVQRAVRRYADSISHDCWADPIALTLSRRTFRPDRTARLSSFSDLMTHLRERLARVGDPVRCLRHPGVRGHASPLDALLSLVTQLSPPDKKNSRLATAGVAPGVRMQGPVRIGRGVRIEPGAMIIGPAALGDAAVIEAGAVVSRSVVMPGQWVPRYGYCHNRVLGPGGESFVLPVVPEIAPARLEQEEEVPPKAASDPIKRAVDVAASALALLLLSPLFVVVALAIKLTSPGPVLFRHRRQGRGGLEFDCLKFRTMVQNADLLQKELRAHNEVDGPQFKIEHDPRVTRLGQWLRRTNVDELPQLINVLAGQLSLVGPRPSPDAENQYCPSWRKLRLSVRPGITGLWQVARSSDRRRTDFQEWIYYDSRYVENRSLWLDLQIIWQTVRVLCRLGPSARWKARWSPAGAGAIR